MKIEGILLRRNNYIKKEIKFIKKKIHIPEYKHPGDLYNCLCGINLLGQVEAIGEANYYNYIGYEVKDETYS